jgi:hypothetical protein
LQHCNAAIDEMRLDALVIAAAAGIVYANDPAPVAFDAGDWYVIVSCFYLSDIV